jgi:hypothetical protein
MEKEVLNLPVLHSQFSRMNSTLKSHSFKIHLSVIPQPCTDLSDDFHFKSNDKINKFLISAIHATFPTDQGQGWLNY